MTPVRSFYEYIFKSKYLQDTPERDPLPIPHQLGPHVPQHLATSMWPLVQIVYSAMQILGPSYLKWTANSTGVAPSLAHKAYCSGPYNFPG